MHKNTYTSVMKFFRFVVSLLSIPLITSCTPTEESVPQNKIFKQFQVVVDNSIKWPGILNQEENKYIIFFYSETCAYCHEMQIEVIDFAITCPLKTYFFGYQWKPSYYRFREENWCYKLWRSFYYWYTNHIRGGKCYDNRQYCRHWWLFNIHQWAKNETNLTLYCM